MLEALLPGTVPELVPAEALALGVFPPTEALALGVVDIEVELMGWPDI